MKKCNKLKIGIEIFFKTLEIFKEYIGKFSNAILQLRNYHTLLMLLLSLKKDCNLYGYNDLYCAYDGRIMRFGNAVYYF